MRAIIAFAAVVIVVVAGAYAWGAAVSTAGDDVTAENESFDPAASPITVDAAGQPGVYLDDPANETVRNSSNTVMQEGVDYEYYPDNGTLVVLEGGDLSNESTGYITYGYQQTSSEQRGLASIFAGQLSLVAGLVFVAIVLLLLAAIRGAM